MPISPPKRRANGAISAIPSLVALAAGLLVGIIAYQTQWSTLLAFQDMLQPVGQIWLRALQMTVFPLVIFNLIVAILNTADAGSFGRIGLSTLALFLLFLIAGGIFAVAVGGPIINALPVYPNAVELLSPLSDSAASMSGQAQQNPSIGIWLMELVPTNPFAVLADGQLLPTLVFTIALALALTKVTTENRNIVQRFFQAMSEAMLVLVGWILTATPYGVFALSAAIATGLGTDAVTVLVQYLILIVAMLVAATILLYPITAVLGGISIARFASGVLPAQIVAVGTRSSLASLPALLHGAEKRIGIALGVANLTLPLSVSLFKINRTITSTIKLLLIAHLFAIDISMGQTLAFVVTIIILSFSTVGIPFGGGGMKSLPAYLAAGIPIEAYILLRAVESIPDIFKTVINVTGNMSVAVIVDRWFAERLGERSVETISANESLTPATAQDIVPGRDER